jgi:hypothetical protein
MKPGRGRDKSSPPCSAPRCSGKSATDSPPPAPPFDRTHNTLCLLPSPPPSTSPTTHSSDPSNMAFDPLCVVSDGVSLYTAFFGYPDARPVKRPGPDLVLARSNPYPSFGNTTWTVVSKVENFNRNLTNMYHNHLCAWNPHSSSIAISARPPGHPTFETRYNLELSADGQIISLHNAADSKDVYGNENGRSLLLHIDPGRGDPNHPWIQIRVDRITNQLVFTYFGKGMTTAGEPQGRWDMVIRRCRYGRAVSNSLHHP